MVYPIFFVFAYRAKDRSIQRQLTKRSGVSNHVPT